ncbi:hypothetical protein A2886_01355 [candidate division WWE3 bacterium RIFCSPHIGHO2_01_FULL_42_13]|uniref:Uncharacterized protein n=1 Tax=candidate division WWE3 bacterium RIFCSPHIGHO2_01_FULL_42_13 TaxID=1802617 RepID=A0A1F4USG9_UNCKA|nr:MAG: hypothetical protein A2886_01355 [candidate division WWE3 bacterium RIFCSPHIGHO2_01_FULL_42_13]
MPFTPKNDFGLRNLTVSSAVRRLSVGAQADVTLIFEFLSCPRITQGVRVVALSDGSNGTKVTLLADSTPKLLGTLEEYGAPIPRGRVEDFLNMVNQSLTDVLVLVPEK